MERRPRFTGTVAPTGGGEGGGGGCGGDCE
jgi:hypothetical protein